MTQEAKHALQAAASRRRPMPIWRSAFQLCVRVFRILLGITGPFTLQPGSWACFTMSLGLSDPVTEFSLVKTLLSRLASLEVDLQSLKGPAKHTK